MKPMAGKGPDIAPKNGAYRIPLENQEKTSKNPIATCLRFETFCMVNLWKRYALKLRSIILLQFELIPFRFAYGRTPKPIISMISGFLNVSFLPKTIYFYVCPIFSKCLAFHVFQ